MLSPLGERDGSSELRRLWLWSVGGGRHARNGRTVAQPPVPAGRPRLICHKGRVSITNPASRPAPLHNTNRLIGGFDVFIAHAILLSSCGAVVVTRQEIPKDRRWIKHPPRPVLKLDNNIVWALLLRNPEGRRYCTARHPPLTKYN